jgi:hypothetical protein
VDPPPATPIPVDERQGLREGSVVVETPRGRPDQEHHEARDQPPPDDIACSGTHGAVYHGSCSDDSAQHVAPHNVGGAIAVVEPDQVPGAGHHLDLGLGQETDHASPDGLAAVGIVGAPEEVGL